MAKMKQHGEEVFFDLQPDYQFSHNGYGLLQLNCNYAVDVEEAGISAVYLARGVSFVPGNGSKLTKALESYPWTCVSAEERGRDGQVAYITAKYAAIDPSKGDFTETEASMTSAVVSEPIESHPNFTKVQIPAIGDGKNPLGGTWVFNAPPAPDNKAVNPFRAQWGPITSPTPGAVQYNFVNFLPSPSSEIPNRKAGVKSWMRPTINLKLTSYTSNSDEAASVCSQVGSIIKEKVGFVSIPEAYKGIGESGLLVNSPYAQSGDRDWLITGANMEVFGGLYKVQVDVLLSGVLGWDRDIYPLSNA